MKEPIPSLNEWKKLYQAAIAFRKIEPWKRMSERDIFGVRNPKTGEIGYCCIMGELGEMLAIAVYNGTEALQGYLKIQKGIIKPGNPDALYIQDCLMLSFENKLSVQEDDLEIINDLGLKFRGKNVWPVFRSYKPGYFPWFLNRDEVLFMTVVLEQAVNICLEVQEGKRIGSSPKRNRYLVRTAEERGGLMSWKDEWVEPATLKKKDGVVSEPVDEIRVQRLKNAATPVAAVWEIDFFYTPTPVSEGERPFFPYAIMIMDHDSGFILDTHLAGETSRRKEFIDRFLCCIEETSSLPLEILVRKDEAAGFFQPYTSRLNIKLSKVKKLPNIDHARREMEKHFKRFR
jgi:hypothetical protein